MPVPTAAKQYLDAGWPVLAIKRGEKRPINRDWVSVTSTLEEFSNDTNVGVRLGAGLADVDLDAPEALVIGKMLLPHNTRIHGRPGNPTSHYWFNTDPKVEQYEVFTDLDGKSTLVELRGKTTHQTVLPPSIHPSGDTLAWENEHAPLFVEPKELKAMVTHVAAATLLARHWPTGSRHAAAGHVAGLLCRLGVPGDGVPRIVRAIAVAAKDEEPDDRERAARDTVAKLAKGDAKVTGGPALAKLLGEQGVELISLLNKWFDKDDYNEVDKMNVRHFVVQIGKDMVVGTEDDERPVSFLSFNGFQQLYRNRFVGKKRLGDFWLDHANRRQHSSVVFAPPPMTARETDYNLWKGFAAEPLETWTQAPIERYLQHVFEVICCGKQDRFEYVIDLLAATVQFPGTPTGKVLAMRGPQGTGKAVSLDTLIPTPDGFKEMGALAIGDKVFDEGGRVCHVVGKTAPHVDPTGTFRVTFDEGSYVVTSGQHEWVTQTLSERSFASHNALAHREQRRQKRPPRGQGLRKSHKRGALVAASPAREGVRTTVQIASSLVAPNGGAPTANHSVRVSGAWEGAERTLPVDPYIVGMWLGDGSSNSGQITIADDELVYALERAGYVPRRLGNHYCVGTRGLMVALRAIGVLNNKHIPLEYLWASAAQRLALLQGLMDTDGCGSPQGGVEFCNTNRLLADGVLLLARSLGIKASLAEGRATLYDKDCGPKYRITWTSSLPVFRLARKLSLLPANTSGVPSRRYIKQVERIEDRACQCIQVDSDSHQYLVTESGIPTHNSLMMRGFGELFGRHYAVVSNRSHVVGNFNAHLSGKVVVFADEALWGGDRQNVGTWKRLVTEKTVMVERKGIDAVEEPNCIHLFMATNEDWMAPAGERERRLVALDVDDRERTGAYFQALVDEIEGPLFKATLLTALQQRDISAGRWRGGLNTRALREQQEFSGGPVQQWWAMRLAEGFVLETDPEWPTAFILQEGYTSYLEEMRELGRHRDLGSRSQFTRKLKRYLPPGTEFGVRMVNVETSKRFGERQRLPRRCAVLPRLATCRMYFDSILKTDEQWLSPKADPDELPLDVTEEPDTY